ncbi:MAG TPA: hypothetical protein VE524_10460 [Nitrososphaeraceae archaeon]|jgi:hypothetical protein|nr:hypothetical protein [Nitrososphaeraceae archaeon]
MSEILLNKFEKEKRVIELNNEGKTIREIAKEVRMSFRDISKLRNGYDKKIRLQRTKEENNTEITTKKLSLSTQAFKLFKEGKKLDEVKVLLDIPFKKAKAFSGQYIFSFCCSRVSTTSTIYNKYPYI